MPNAINNRSNLSLAGLIAASLAATAPAAGQEIKLTLADQNSPTAWGPSSRFASYRERFCPRGLNAWALRPRHTCE